MQQNLKEKIACRVDTLSVITKVIIPNNFNHIQDFACGFSAIQIPKFKHKRASWYPATRKESLIFNCSWNYARTGTAM